MMHPNVQQVVKKPPK